MPNLNGTDWKYLSTGQKMQWFWKLLILGGALLFCLGILVTILSMMLGG